MEYEKPFAVILAGGRGTRLGVLTNHRTKPAVGFGGKYRIIDWVLSNCMISSLNDLYLITQFEPTSLKQHIGEGIDWGFNGVDKVLTNLNPRQDEYHNGITCYLGTADAVRQNLSSILFLDPKLILILAGDHIYTEDYSNIVKSHIEKKALVSIYAQPVSEEHVHEYGIMMLNNDARIIDFAEKTKEKSILKKFQLSSSMQKSLGITNPKHKYIASMGIYLFEKLLLKDAMDMQGNDFGKEIIPQIIKEYKRVYAHLFFNYWQDVGLIKTFYESNMDLLGPRREEILTSCLRTNTRYRHLPSPVVLGNVSNSIISNGCIIEKNSQVNNSILGYQVKVESGTTIENSILLGASHHFKRDGKMLYPVYTQIGSNSHLRHVIVDKNVWIGKNVKIGIENLSIKERHIRLQSIGLMSHSDYDIKEDLLVIGKQNVFRDKSIIPDDFQC